MKKLISITLALLLVLALAACGSAGKNDSGFTWTREGSFEDENGNYLSVMPSDDEENPGWYVGVIIGEEMHGWYIPLEGEALHGNLISEYDDAEGEFIVTITEEGEDGLYLVVDDGDSYHFTPMEEPEASVIVRINTEGLGQIAYSEDGEPEFDDEYPAQSAQLNLSGGETYIFAAKADEGWKFVKWTKDGEDYSEEARITVELTESAEYVAVFEGE